MYRNRHSYKPVARFSTWLYTIAGNRGRTKLQKLLEDVCIPREAA